MRRLSRDMILMWLATITAVYHLIVVAQLPTWFGVFIPHTSHKAISVSLALIMIFWLRTPSRRRNRPNDEPEGPDRAIAWYDLLLMASALGSAGFVVFFHERFLDYGFFGALDTTGMIFAMMLIVPLLEGVRRTTGWVLPIIILTFVAITVFQKYLPGILYGVGYAPHRLLYSSFIGDAGIFGRPLGIAANIVIVFLIFGALMERAGASRWFMDLALALTGWSSGGPAKAAVVSSAMFGSISGSPSGNSATTGIFTIPMMKQIGYSAPFAAAVEAVASTGGLILPPVMGAIAFLMAEWLELKYAEIAFAAAVPACLYFLIVFVSVHLQAKRYGIKSMRRIDLPPFWRTLRSGWYYAIPIAALIYFLLVAKYRPGMAGIYACAFVLLTSYLSPNRDNWLTPARIMDAFKSGVTRWLVIAAITGSVGIMIGALELSGVGIKVSRFIIDIAGGNLLLTLVLVGIASLIVGMGLDATPAYITLATLLAPALVQLGVPPLTAHLYVVYWGLASFFTPPTCIAVFVTAGIANSRIWPSGWEAVRLGIAAFIIPLAFVYNPGLLLRAGAAETVLSIGSAVIGSIAVAMGVRGFGFAPLGVIRRLVVLAGGLLLISPGLQAAAVGIGLIVVTLAIDLPLLLARLESRSTKIGHD